MEMQYKKVLLLSFFIATSTSWAIADEKAATETPVKTDKEKKVDLGEIVVTATRTAKDAASAPASVAVVTRSDIEKTGAKSVDEALSSIPGGYAPRNVNGGMMDSLANGALTLRGVPRASSTLFMVDGIILNDAYSGSQRSSLAVSPESVERIEVVKGPFSSLYGGNAVGGVVNIMTRMPEKREFVVKTGYGTALESGEAPEDVKSFYVSGGDKFNDKLSVLVSYGYKSTDGYPTQQNVQSSKPTTGISGWTETTDTTGSKRYLIGDSGDKAWWDDNFSLKTGYDFSKETKLNLSFTNARFEYEFGDPHTYLQNAAGNPVWSYGAVKDTSYYQSGTSRNEERRYGLNYETAFSQVKVKATLGYNDRPEYYYITPKTLTSGEISSTVSSSLNSDLQLSVPLWERQVLTVGGGTKHAEADTSKYNLANWRNEDSKTSFISDAGGRDQTLSLFAQDEIKILDNLTGYLGFRNDWWETSDGYANPEGDEKYPSREDSAFSPKAALVYQPLAGTTVRSSVGKSFRPPTVYELYSVWIYSGKTTMADPNLEPETNTSWDLGAEQRLWKGAKFGVTYFENYMENLIYSQTISPTLVQRTNVGKAESRGVELEIEQKITDTLKVFANFTYTDSEVTENEAKPSIVGKQLVQVPEKIFNAGGDYSYGPFSVSLVGHYVGKRYGNDENSDTVDGVYTSYDPYFVADARVTYKVTDYAEVSVSIDNIFNEEYYSYYEAPGTSCFSELTIKF